MSETVKKKGDILNMLDSDWQPRWPIGRLFTPLAVTYNKLCGHMQALSTQQSGYVRATNLYYYYYY